MRTQDMESPLAPSLVSVYSRYATVHPLLLQQHNLHLASLIGAQQRSKSFSALASSLDCRISGASFFACAPSHVVDSLICPICLEVFKNPVISPCRHVACGICFVVAVHLRGKCPLCNFDINRASSLEPFPLRSILSSMTRAQKSLHDRQPLLMPKREEEQDIVVIYSHLFPDKNEHDDLLFRRALTELLRTDYFVFSYTRTVDAARALTLLLQQHRSLAMKGEDAGPNTVEHIKDLFFGKYYSLAVLNPGKIGEREFGECVDNGTTEAGSGRRRREADKSYGQSLLEKSVLFERLLVSCLHCNETIPASVQLQHQQEGCKYMRCRFAVFGCQFMIERNERVIQEEHRRVMHQLEQLESSLNSASVVSDAVNREDFNTAYAEQRNEDVAHDEVVNASVVSESDRRIHTFNSPQRYENENNRNLDVAYERAEDEAEDDADCIGISDLCNEQDTQTRVRQFDVDFQSYRLDGEFGPPLAAAGCRDVFREHKQIHQQLDRLERRLSIIRKQEKQDLDKHESSCVFRLIKCACCCKYVCFANSYQVSPISQEILPGKRRCADETESSSYCNFPSSAELTHNDNLGNCNAEFVGALRDHSFIDNERQITNSVDSPSHNVNGIANPGSSAGLPCHEDHRCGSLLEFERFGGVRNLGSELRSVSPSGASENVYRGWSNRGSLTYGRPVHPPVIPPSASSSCFGAEDEDLAQDMHPQVSEQIFSPFEQAIGYIADEERRIEGRVMSLGYEPAAFEHSNKLLVCSKDCTLKEPQRLRAELTESLFLLGATWSIGFPVCFLLGVLSSLCSKKILERMQIALPCISSFVAGDKNTPF